jgi:hypothetical protein
MASTVFVKTIPTPLDDGADLGVDTWVNVVADAQPSQELGHIAICGEDMHGGARRNTFWQLL